MNASDKIMSAVLFGREMSNIQLTSLVASSIDEADKAIQEAKENGFVIGKKVKLTHDKEIGIVVGYNENPISGYPTARYPIMVQFERGKFEYTVRELKLVK
jgi:hypothetical protein